MNKTIMEHSDSSSVSPALIDEFDNIHAMLCVLTEKMQRHFDRDTGGRHHLIAPQGNIMYALNASIAQEMIRYFSHVLISRLGFTHDEFIFKIRSSHEEHGLQRIRLEFKEGVNAKIIRKIALSLNDLDTPVMN